jgi:hypothetical protein
MTPRPLSFATNRRLLRFASAAVGRCANAQATLDRSGRLNRDGVASAGGGLPAYAGERSSLGAGEGTVAFPALYGGNATRTEIRDV